MLSLRTYRNASGNKKKKNSHAKNETLVEGFRGFVQSYVFIGHRVVIVYYNPCKTAEKPNTVATKATHAKSTSLPILTKLLTPYKRLRPKHRQEHPRTFDRLKNITSK